MRLCVVRGCGALLDDVVRRRRLLSAFGWCGAVYCCWLLLHVAVRGRSLLFVGVCCCALRFAAMRCCALLCVVACGWLVLFVVRRCCVLPFVAACCCLLMCGLCASLSAVGCCCLS